VFRIPRLAGTQDGIQDRQQFTHASNDMALVQLYEVEKGEPPAASRCTTKVLEAFDDENQWEQLCPPVFLGYAEKGSME